MANQRHRQGKEPWNNQTNRREKRQESGLRADRVERRQISGRGSKSKGLASTVFLTVLVVITFIFIAGAIFFTVWNNRHPNMNTVANSFYPKSKQDVASKVNVSSSGSSSSSSSAATDSSGVGTTYSITAEDSTMVALEKNTGLSWEKLCKLNTNLDPNNQGKNKDGSWIYVGEVLKIK